MRVFHPSNAFIEAVCNHPRVRPTLDLGSRRLRACSLPLNTVTLAFDGGVALFVPRSIVRDVYDGHVAVHPRWWGRPALAFGKAAVTRLFEEYGAARLEVQTSAQLPTAAAYCRRLGLKPEGRDLFQEYFSMEAEQWAA